MGLTHFIGETKAACGSDRSISRHACSWSNNFISFLTFILRVHPGQLAYVDQVVELHGIESMTAFLKRIFVVKMAQAYPRSLAKCEPSFHFEENGLLKSIGSNSQSPKLTIKS
uniref:Uncharacterized protein n=1 Tax=Vitis vinifera TaxID=29760 RepID=A5C8I1_VITVI|nr:hypothetical protein VITISV_004746 [Vitis vinifera]